jgi:hypothetical protein
MFVAMLHILIQLNSRQTSLLNSSSTIFDDIFLFILNKLTFFAVYSYEVAALTETQGEEECQKKITHKY